MCHLQFIPYDSICLCDCLNATSLVGCAGSLRYMAPEGALNRPYNEKVDMYSHAIILYEIITGYPAFDGFSRMNCVLVLMMMSTATLSASMMLIPPPQVAADRLSAEKVLNRYLGQATSRVDYI